MDKYQYYSSVFGSLVCQCAVTLGGLGGEGGGRADTAAPPHIYIYISDISFFGVGVGNVQAVLRVWGIQYIALPDLEE